MFVSHSLHSSSKDEDTGGIRRRTIEITVSSARHKQTVLMLKVNVRPLPFVVHRDIRFENPENEFLRQYVLGCWGVWCVYESDIL